MPSLDLLTGFDILSTRIFDGDHTTMSTTLRTSMDIITTLLSSLSCPLLPERLLNSYHNYGKISITTIDFIIQRLSRSWKNGYEKYQPWDHGWYYSEMPVDVVIIIDRKERKRKYLVPRHSQGIQIQYGISLMWKDAWNFWKTPESLPVYCIATTTRWP